MGYLPIPYLAGVSKPGQRSRVEGPVTQVFAGSNPVPRTNLPVKHIYLGVQLF
jgi:hypothetical protein